MSGEEIPDYFPIDWQYPLVDPRAVYTQKTYDDRTVSKTYADMSRVETRFDDGSVHYEPLKGETEHSTLTREQLEKEKVRHIYMTHVSIEFEGMPELIFPLKALKNAGVQLNENPEGEEIELPDEAYQELLKTGINPRLN